jgi:predicted nucleotidyltransferase
VYIGPVESRAIAVRKLDDVMAELRRLQPELRRRYPIRQMGVFGSYVHGKQRADSDLDILVELGDGIGLMEFVGLKQELSDAFGLEVDLVSRDALKPRIGQRILAEVVML